MAIDDEEKLVQKILVGFLVLLLGALGMTAALAGPPGPPVPDSPIEWTGNGTDDGFCSDVSNDPALAPGTQAWLFILTSPSGSQWTLTGEFADAGVFGPIAGTQQGQGSIHFTVFSGVGDQLLSAEATNGTTVSILTVSHCETNNGTTTTTQPESPTTQPTTPEVPFQPESFPPFIVATPTLTG